MLCNEDDEWDITDDDLCDHSWYGGLVYVADEDLESIAKERARKGIDPIECMKCEKKYIIN